MCDILDAFRENSNTNLYSHTTRQASFKIGMGHLRYMLSSHLVCSLIRFKEHLIKPAKWDSVMLTQGDSGGICNILENDNTCDSKQKS